MAYLFLKDEKLKPFFFLGIVLALCGTAMIIFNETIVLELNPIGDILALFAAASWAVYSLFVKRAVFSRIRYKNMPKSPARIKSSSFLIL